jgi:two-component system, NarL family, nitrate/nitrite response regulator NarL
MSMVVRVLVVDRHPIFSRGLQETLPAVSDDQVRVVASTAVAESAAALVHGHLPDVALVDLDLAPPGGLSVIQTLRDVEPQLPILALTEQTGANQTVVDALAAGARGVLVRACRPAELGPGLLAVADGHKPASSGEAQCPPLTDDELRLWALIADGFSTTQIAGVLHVSERTVKRLTSALLRALGVANRTEAVILAIRSGLLDGLPPRLHPVDDGAERRPEPAS